MARASTDPGTGVGATPTSRDTGHDDEQARRRAAELAGIDALETHREPPGALALRAWSVLWPKVAAVAIFFGLWQAVAWSDFRPDYLLPGPVPVLQRLAEGLASGELVRATGITLTRGVGGFAVAVVIGAVVGLLVASVPLLRTAVGSLITGVQTMPSIAWFPLAILLFQLSERAILFVVVLGAAPAIANGLLHGIDQTPPLLHRAGRVLGATGLQRWRFVVLPAALPGFVGGLKQGWAFAWRSLMAGELLVIIATRPSLGQRLQFSASLSDTTGLLAVMLIVLIVGIAVDGLFFGRLERAVQRRWGLAAR